MLNNAMKNHAKLRANDTSETVPQQSASTTSAEISYDFTVQAYNERLLALTMIKQLMHLCRDTQKHRGLGMGLLAGNDHFAERFELLQQQMARRVVLLSAFANKPENPINASDIDKIVNAWETIRAGWHDDSVLENFQFHSHFIEQLLLMVMRIAECLREPLTQVLASATVSSVNTEGEITSVQPVAYHKPHQQILHDELLLFICRKVPNIIEYAGKLRALSTHAATVGYAIDEHDKKLNYVCQCIKTNKIEVLDQAQQLNTQLGHQIPSLLVMKTYEFKLDAFIDKMNNNVIGQKKITVSSDDLFAKATEIIDVYWRVVDDGLDVLHRLQEQELEQWCVKG